MLQMTAARTLRSAVPEVRADDRGGHRDDQDAADDGKRGHDLADRRDRRHVAVADRRQRDDREPARLRDRLERAADGESEREE